MLPDLGAEHGPIEFSPRERSNRRARERCRTGAPGEGSRFGFLGGKRPAESVVRHEVFLCFGRSQKQRGLCKDLGIRARSCENGCFREVAARGQAGAWVDQMVKIRSPSSLSRP